MTEAMGRKQLRTAMQGMTAMGSAKQPTEREKLLSEMMPRQPQQTIMSVPSQGAGLDQLPADNMQGLADGGIIAFKEPTAQNNNSLVTDQDDGVLERLRRDDPKSYERFMRGNTISSEFGGSSITAEQDAERIAKIKEKLGYDPDTVYKSLYPPTVPSKLGDIEDPAGAIVLSPVVTPPKTGAGPSTGSGPGGGGPGGAGPSTGGGFLPGTPLSKFATKQAELLRPKERSKDYYEALTKPTEDIAKQVASGKSQAQGEFLMQLGASLMATPNLGLALSKGVQAGLPGLAASRKEINALTKDQRDYQFNIAKAKEARDQGDEMLALNYLKLAEESKYHAGMVGAYMARATAGGSANTFGPKQYQAAMVNAQKEVDAKIGKMNPLDKRAAEKNRDQLIEAAFTRNLEAYKTGAIPATQDPSLELFEKPGGPILTRPQK
jgi:hypothetical protein